MQTASNRKTKQVTAHERTSDVTQTVRRRPDGPSWLPRL